MPYLRFIPQPLTDGARRGYRVSGMHLTETPSGYWLSPGRAHDGYRAGLAWNGPNLIWRSQCGHAVDSDVLVCPVCGEAKPQ